MSKKAISNLDEVNLKICINELRDTLNKMCCTINESDELRIEKLSISCQLDQLIVKYMNLKNKCEIENKE